MSNEVDLKSLSYRPCCSAYFFSFVCLMVPQTYEFELGPWLSLRIN